MSLRDRVVIIGAGVFGLSTAVELSNLGYTDIVVLDRHVPPVSLFTFRGAELSYCTLTDTCQVPDGSSVDISRIIRFDYGDPVYTKIAKEAYAEWSTPTYTSNGIFHATPFVMAANANNSRACSWIERCIKQLKSLELPYEQMASASTTKDLFPMLSGPLIETDLYGYCNRSAGGPMQPRLYQNCGTCASRRGFHSSAAHRAQSLASKQADQARSQLSKQRAATIARASILYSRLARGRTSWCLCTTPHSRPVKC